jgi:hypothetical protein
MNQNFSNEIGLVMVAALDTGLFVSLCTISAPDGNLGPSGAPSNTFVDIPGLIDIPCMDAVPSEARIQATEVKDLAEILATGLRHVALNGYYPQIIPGVALGWRATVDGTVYDLIGAEPDSQGTQTRLHLRLSSV